MGSFGMQAADRRAWARLGVPALAFAWAAAWILGDGHAKLSEAVSDIGLSIVPILAAFACWRASRVSDGRVRAFWALIAGAVFAWSLGHVAAIWYQATRGETLQAPWLGDVGYLCAVPLVIGAMLAVPAGTQTFAGRVRTLIDGWMIAASALLTSWVFVLSAVVGHETSRVAHTVSVLYPIGDIVVVTVVLYVVLRIHQTGSRPPVPVGVVGAGLLVIALSDSAFAYLTTTSGYRPGSGVDVGWFGGFAIVLLAALTARGVDLPPSEHSYRPSGMLLPTVAIVSALASSSFELFRDGKTTPFVSWVRVLLVLAIIVRLLLALRENSSLTERLEARLHELRASERRFEALVQHSSEVVTVVDGDGTVTYQSESMLPVFGYPAAKVVGVPMTGIFDERSGKRFLAALRELAPHRGAFRRLELDVRHADGRWCHAELTMTNLLEDANVKGLVLNTRDVSERKALQDRLVHEASHDSLTSLANRALFRDRVEADLRKNEEQEARLTILFLDLDGFKEVNDSLGHATGDMLLMQVAERLRSCVRPVDTVARLGGDEFAILLADKSAERDGSIVAERVIESLRPPFRVAGRELYIGASIGIAATDQDVSDADHLLRNADLAMYRAKASGQSGFERYDPRFHAALVERRQLEADFREALSTGGLELHYQPSLSLRDGRISGVEALARWKHHERGYVSPGEFVPLAEHTGLVCELGRWVLHEACRCLVEWTERIPARSDLTVSVNISGRHLQELSLIDDVREALAVTGLPPSRLVLEITESVLMVNTEECIDLLGRLHELGIGLAIDDFGTGYSSLAYLDRFPADVIKIDRSFVERLGGSESDTELLNAVVRLAHTLGKVTVAEGVETEAQARALRLMGCELAQGFLFYRPLPQDQVERLLRPSGEADRDGLEAA
jgi:diguanylate cyclase (GGDEF)-like protein/PAS domain S-box-containing protein